MRGPGFLVMALVWTLAAIAPARGEILSVSAPTTAASAAVVIKLAGEIDEFNRDTLMRRFDEARRLGASTVILQIDTWGGLANAALDVSRYIKRQEDLHTIAFVDQKAISAGAMIALACDEVVMSPASQLGDCAPITLGATGGIEPLPDTERAKFESPILEDFYDSAVRNGRDPLVLQSMVSVGRVVHWVQNSAGERKFVDAAGYEKLKGEGWTPVPDLPDPIDDGKSLLTVGTDRAIKLGLASGEARTPQDLAEQRGLRIVSTLAPGTFERLVGLLSSMLVRGVLTTVFMLALYWSFSHPGQGAPEAVALTALGILVGVPLLTGYAQWWEIIAIVLGLALIAVEIFLLPGFGVAGVTGLVLMFAGLVMTWVGNEPAGLPGGIIPSLPGTRAAIQQSLIVVVVGLVCSLALWVWLQQYLPKLPYVNKLILATSSGNMTLDAESSLQPITWPMIGATGVVVTDLRPGGTARFDDPSLGGARVTDVISDSGFVRAGVRVVVRESTGNRVVVRAV